MMDQHRPFQRRSARRPARPSLDPAYDAWVFPHTLLLIDRDEGRSLTNDMENVLADLLDRNILRPGMRLYYQDTQERWDEVDLLWRPSGALQAWAFRPSEQVPPAEMAGVGT